MINYHPTNELLMQYVKGDLPASISIAIAIHCQYCDECQQQVEMLTQENAVASFEFSSDDLHGDLAFEGMEEMLFAITSDDEISEQVLSKESVISVKGNKYTLPRALNNVGMSNWRSLGKLSRSSLNLEEGAVHSHLLHIEAGGEVPCHTHKGYEITLLLDGSFEDEMGRYSKGDFIMLDGQHNHQPKTKEGCLCYTVADDALHFTQGIHKLFNPIGGLIY